MTVPQSLHFAKAGLPHGVPVSLSLDGYSIWKKHARENAPDSVKPWGIWPELTSHLSQCYDALNCLEGCPISRARGDLTLLAPAFEFQRRRPAPSG